MEITLSLDEAGVVREVLEQYLSDLRAEIGKTESYDMRQELHQRERIVSAVISRLTA